MTKKLNQSIRSDKEIKEILEDLFFNKLDVEKNLREYIFKVHVRNKYGSFFKLEIKKDEE